MSEFSTPQGGGVRAREIQVTRTVDPKTGATIVTPVLDANGREIELSVVVIPQHIEAVEGTRLQRAVVLDDFVADMKTKSADVALLRAAATMSGADPAAAESAFTAAQAAGAVAAASPGAAVAPQPGGLS